MTTILRLLPSTLLTVTVAAALLPSPAQAELGVGAKPVNGGEVLFDGTKEMLDAKWMYWEGPGFKSAMPIKWKIVDDPVIGGKAESGPGARLTVMQTDDRAADGGKFGAADIVTKRPHGDARLHVEFLCMKKGGNSGVYLQNRYEIQVLDGDKGSHGMAAVIDQAAAPVDAYNGTGKWNAYDITFRAPRFKDGKMVEKPLVTIYFNGQKIHTNVKINQVVGGKNSGVDGDKDGGKGITETPAGLKLQNEGHDVRYRNIWVKDLELKDADTDFKE